MGNNRIDAASELTEFVEQQFDRVRQEIALPRRFNGYGVYRARREVRQSLAAIRHEIQRAIDGFDAVPWPSQKDYETYDEQEQ